MTNGDFAFFTWQIMRSSRSDHPWSQYTIHPDDLQRRRRAFYAVKQVFGYSPFNISAATYKVAHKSRPSPNH